MRPSRPPPPDASSAAGVSASFGALSTPPTAATAHVCRRSDLLRIQVDPALIAPHPELRGGDQEHGVTVVDGIGPKRRVLPLLWDECTAGHGPPRAAPDR